MTFFNQYMVLTYLARGAFGKVYLCLNTADHRLYAVKVWSASHLVVTRASRHGDSLERHGSHMQPKQLSTTLLCGKLYTLA